MASAGHPGYIWTVYPQSSGEPMVSLGHSKQEQTARARVETELATVDNAAWGVVIGPGGLHDVCRRNASGGFCWAPLFAECQGRSLVRRWSSWVSELIDVLTACYQRII
jgi:hypothetical protein